MTFIVDAVRKLGLQAFIKTTSRKLGYELWPKQQHPGTTFLGLRKYPIRTILDIGALRGEIAVNTFVPMFTNATIHCFEPSPKTYPLLAQTAKRSGGRIFAHPYALGDRNERATFHITVDAVASSSLLKSTAENHVAYPQTTRSIEEAVEVRRLDEVAPLLMPGLTDEILIKMDVQGFEDRVIKGGMETFRRARACIMEVQCANLYVGQPSFKELFLLMDSLGFEYIGNLDQVHSEEGNVMFFDAVFLR